MSVYFIKDEHGRVKIGHLWDPEGRRGALQTAHADRLEIVRKIDGGHSQLKDGCTTNSLIDRSPESGFGFVARC